MLFETLSMVALGMLERRILIMGGLPLRPGRAIALAYASNALSASLPVVGSGAATTFTYRRLVSQGATPALAGWSLTLSGIASNAAFVLIISIGGIVSGNIAGVVAGAIGTVLTLVAVVVTVIAMRRPPARERVTRAVIWTLGRVQRLIRRAQGGPGRDRRRRDGRSGRVWPEPPGRRERGVVRDPQLDLRPALPGFQHQGGRGARPVVGHRPGLGGRAPAARA